MPKYYVKYPEEDSEADREFTHRRAIEGLARHLARRLIQYYPENLNIQINQQTIHNDKEHKITWHVEFRDSTGALLEVALDAAEKKMCG